MRPPNLGNHLRLVPRTNEGELYLIAHDTDHERMRMALIEMGLEPSDSGDRSFSWDRWLEQDEYDLVVKAERLSNPRGDELEPRPSLKVFDPTRAHSSRSYS